MKSNGYNTNKPTKFKNTLSNYIKDFKKNQNENNEANKKFEDDLVLNNLNINDPNLNDLNDINYFNTLNDFNDEFSNRILTVNNSQHRIIPSNQIQPSNLMTENNSGTFRKDIRKNNSVDGKKKANILPKRNIIVHKTNTQKDNRSNYTSANPTYREKINQTIKSKSKNPNRNFQHLNISAELPQKKAYKQKGSSNSMQTRNIEDNYNTFNTNNKNYISCNNSKNNINNCINSTKIQNSNDIDKKKTIQKEEELTKLSHNFVKKISTSSILAPPKKTEEDDKNYIDILNDLKSIFGENLENFDICYLLGELDEGSTKGLIKGLVMQAYHQEKELKKVKEELEYLKNKKSPKEEQENYKKELLKEIESKDEKIEFLTLRIQKMNLILKEVTLDNENLLKKINN